MSAKQEVVINCVKSVLINHGWSSPIDPNGTMGGYYKYKPPLMIAFHNQVAICLASKGYNYKYSHDNAFMAKTLAMTLLALCAAIAAQTNSGSLLVASVNFNNLQDIVPSMLPSVESASVQDKVATPLVKRPKKRRAQIKKPPSPKPRKLAASKRKSDR